MSKTITLTLDDEIGAYLERIAADQDRAPAEVAAWIVSEDLRREQAIDAELLARLENPAADTLERKVELATTPSEVAHREQASA